MVAVADSGRAAHSAQAGPYSTVRPPSDRGVQVSRSTHSASAIVLTTLAWTMNLVHPYFYLAISIMLCIVIGYLASLFFPAPTRSLKGLTIYTDHD